MRQKLCGFPTYLSIMALRGSVFKCLSGAPGPEFLKEVGSVSGLKQDAENIIFCGSKICFSRICNAGVIHRVLLFFNALADSDRLPFMGKIFFALLFTSLSISAAFALEPFAPLPLPGAAAGFDFMAADPSLDRILAAHRDARTLEIIDLKTGKALKPVLVGAAQGLAVNTAEHIYYVGNEADKNVVAVDARTFAIKGKTKVDGPVDAIAFDPTNSRIYAAEDDGNRVWVIDAKTMDLIQVIEIPGVPEVLEYDTATDRLYLNIKNKDEIVRIDPTTSRVDATWPTAPVVSPHGLAIDHEWGMILTVGSNGKLAALDIHTGKLIANANVAPHVDQIAYDEKAKVVYGAAKGFLTATKVEKTALTSLPSLPSPKGAHTVAVDTSRHEAWVCFKDAKHSYLQKFGQK